MRVGKPYGKAAPDCIKLAFIDGLHPNDLKQMKDCLEGYWITNGSDDSNNY